MPRLPERVQSGLAMVTAGCATVMVVGGILCKSSRWGGHQGWIDGVNPRAIRAFLGGWAILALLGAGWWFERWLLPAIGAMALFARAGTAAVAYRDRLETSFADQQLYSDQDLALGLYLVPVAGTAGATCAALLAIVSFWMLLADRRAAGRSRLVQC